jgi:hypothetical protein
MNIQGDDRARCPGKRRKEKDERKDGNDGPPDPWLPLPSAMVGAGSVFAAATLPLPPAISKPLLMTAHPRTVALAVALGPDVEGQ